MNAIIFSALLGVVMMFSSILLQNKATIKMVAVAGLFILLLSNLAEIYGWFTIKVDTKGMLLFTRYGLFFNSIAILSTLVYVLLSGNEMGKVGNYKADYLALIFFILCGISILSSYNNTLMLFLGVEIMTIPLYILTGTDKRNLKSNEASLKYLLMGAFSTGIMLMGITLLYGAVGNFNVEGSTPKENVLATVGLLLLFISLAFKVSAAPFHFWTPDVYDGAPSVFTAFMATIVKAAGFIAFIHLFEARASSLGASYKIVLILVIVATLAVGNITAVFQQSVKRMLAYSSIAQAGFMLFALYSQNDMAKEGILLYSVAYSFATIGIFAVLMKMKDYTYDGYNGLAKTQPLLAAANTVFLLSLAGIPLTAGFFAKYYMLASVIKTAGTFSVTLAIIGVLFAAVSVYYYFRVIQAMYFKEGDGDTQPVSASFKYGLIALAAVIIIIGIMPSWLLNWLYF